MTVEQDTKGNLMGDITRAVVKLLTYQGVDRADAMEYGRLVAVAAFNWATNKVTRDGQS